MKICAFLNEKDVSLDDIEKQMHSCRVTRIVTIGHEHIQMTYICSMNDFFYQSLDSRSRVTKVLHMLLCINYRVGKCWTTDDEIP